MHAISGLAVCLVSTLYSQSIKVGGTVKDASDRPIANATVELLRAKHKDTTGADGAFSLDFVSNAVRRSAASSPGNVSLRKGLLELATSQPAPLSIEIFDMKGNLLDRLAMEAATAGTYRLDLAGRIRSRNLVMVKASVGGTTKAFPYLSTDRAAAPAGFTREYSARDGATLAKVSAVAVDTLQITAAGFAGKKVMLSSYDTTVHVTLEAAGDYWGGLKNPPGRSAGCGKAAALTNGKKTITSGGRQRNYIIDIPANYDLNKPYRLFYASHGLGGQAEHVVGWNFFGLKTQATAANEPAIFIAPQAIERWGESDHALFDDIMALAKGGLCVDTTRIFVTGMSFGGMITYSLSTNHQKRFRAGVGLAPANFNIWLPNPKLRDPIAWMQTTGMSDQTCPWDGGNGRGSKYIALEKAADNGCTVPATLPTWKQGDPGRHICVDLQGCKSGYPVKVCTFNGGHWQFPYDDGNGENLARSWVPVESWKFFTQF